MEHVAGALPVTQTDQRIAHGAEEPHGPVGHAMIAQQRQPFPAQRNGRAEVLGVHEPVDAFGQVLRTCGESALTCCAGVSVG